VRRAAPAPNGGGSDPLFREERVRAARGSAARQRWGAALRCFVKSVNRAARGGGGAPP